MSADDETTPDVEPTDGVEIDTATDGKEESAVAEIDNTWSTRLIYVFLLVCAVYCWTTRWYLFPVMCLNAGYLATRFVSVQDTSYLLMLLVVMAALWSARARRGWSPGIIRCLPISKAAWPASRVHRGLACLAPATSPMRASFRP